jgi:hypothetical protein
VYNQALANDSPPRFLFYPSQTGIYDVPFSGQIPNLLQATPPVWWSIFNTPPGMIINPSSGAITWEHPTEGRHVITICATNNFGADYAEWVLRVVPNDFPDPCIVSTTFIDFVVPPDIAQWIQTWGAGAWVDACWRRMRSVVGREPLDDRQIVRYDPDGGGGGHSGNPVEAGPFWWSTDPVQGWSLGVWIHEVGHNFHAETRIGRIIENNWADTFFHHGMEFTQVSVELRVLENPQSFGLSGTARDNYISYCQWLRQEMDRRCQPYRTWLSLGGRAENYTQDPYGAWAWICRELADLYGPQILENTIRTLRVDALPEATYDLADTPLKKNTLLFCIMSCAANADLRTFFNNWGFDVDDSFYASVLTTVSQTVAQLPGGDFEGYLRCPLNNHYYKLTSWTMPWYEAQRTAHRSGGHLSTVRSADEDEWLRKCFGRGALWVGLSDAKEEGQWLWDSQEPLTYTNWGSGEPGGKSSENFCALNWWGTSAWNDADNFARLFGIIELTNFHSDFNGDGVVNFVDFAQLAQVWMQNAPSFDIAPSGDNGFIDISDFTVFASHWLETIAQ